MKKCCLTHCCYRDPFRDPFRDQFHWDLPPAINSSPLGPEYPTSCDQCVHFVDDAPPWWRHPWDPPPPHIPSWDERHERYQHDRYEHL